MLMTFIWNVIIIAVVPIAERGPDARSLWFKVVELRDSYESVESVLRGVNFKNIFCSNNNYV